MYFTSTNSICITNKPLHILVMRDLQQHLVRIPTVLLVNPFTGFLTSYSFARQLAFTVSEEFNSYIDKMLR